ncbi:prepilin-type N-terminal cleavage/methylation domain-containing protein [bacterium]|nr:prepilin-type N-terminal cleavage/methylation domain-containing protein [bacterium]
MWKKKQPAFTLIEVLVTIAIIGILSALGVNSYLRALKNGRDGRRKADLAQIAQALVTYRYEKGTYPSSIATSVLTSDYINPMPVDPINNATYRYSYTRTNSGKGFQICARLETNTGNATTTNSGDTQCLFNP